MKVICIVVLYKPSTELLEKAIKSIVNQVDLVWISDNTPGGFKGMDTIAGVFKSKLKYALMDGNVGIAKAQNAGIQYALDNDFDFIYFLDQDSISPSGIVNGLLQQFLDLEDKGIKVGGVGAQPFNRDTGKIYEANVKKGKQVKDGVVEVTELINSSSLFTKELFISAGMMDESLFIDGVDHELCWRANHKDQYRFFKVTSLLLNHKQGEGDRKILGITIRTTTPFRIYYQYRNYFWLIRREYVPAYWKVSNGIKYICKYFYYPLFCKPRISFFKRINKGIHDGLVQ
jgi:rhamnosyltransferase